MSHGKYGLKAFGLAIVAALGLMAFMAVGAQANWLYLEGGVAHELTSNELVEVTKHSSDGTLLIEGVNIQFLCQTITGGDVLLEPGNATTANATGKVEFGTCTAIEKSTGKEAAKCNPINQPIKAAGKAKIFLHTNGQNYVLFEPNKNAKGELEPFAVIEVSELCALTETSKVTGSLVAECGELNASSVFVQEDCKNHQVKHLLRQAPEALFPTHILKYGTHKSTIDGIAAAELAGVGHKGQSWSGEV